LISDDLLKTVERLSHGILLGLQNLDLQAEYRPREGIFISEKKVSGSASAVKRNFFFNHGTLLINSNLNILSEVLNPTIKKLTKRGVKSRHQRVTTLEVELGREISISEVKEALKLGFERAFQIEIMHGELVSEEILLAHSLLKKKDTEKIVIPS
jgi:lipoate-protein ligase A